MGASAGVPGRCGRAAHSGVWPWHGRTEMAEEEKAKDPTDEKDAAQERAAAFWAEVRDAKLVLEFAVASGFTTADGRKLDNATIAAIKKAEDAVGADKLPNTDARTEFEQAYRDLTL